jgi:hypothetical protein
MIDVAPHPDGSVVAVRVQPRARRAGIAGTHAGSLKVAVTEPPEKGKANQAVIDLLCERLSLSRSQVQLLSGETSRNKRLLVAGLRPAELITRISRLAEHAS